MSLPTPGRAGFWVTVRNSIDRWRAAWKTSHPVIMSGLMIAAAVIVARLLVPRCSC